jgi:hypothetical protein
VLIGFYLKRILPLTLFFLVFSLAARAVGTTQPVNPALRGFVEGCEDKSQPCWFGIVPGRTTAEQAYRILSHMGYEISDSIFGNTRQLQTRLLDRADCGQIIVNVDQRIGVVYQIYTHPCQLVLGDFVKAFGIPTVVDITYEPCRIRLQFLDARMQVIVENTVQLTHEVAGFGLLSDETVRLELDRNLEIGAWAGVLPMWRYKSRFSQNAVCR